MSIRAHTGERILSPGALRIHGHVCTKVRAVSVRCYIYASRSVRHGPLTLLDVRSIARFVAGLRGVPLCKLQGSPKINTPARHLQIRFHLQVCRSNEGGNQSTVKHFAGFV